MSYSTMLWTVEPKNLGGKQWTTAKSEHRFFCKNHLNDSCTMKYLLLLWSFWLWLETFRIKENPKWYEKEEKKKNRIKIPPTTGKQRGKKMSTHDSNKWHFDVLYWHSKITILQQHVANWKNVARMKRRKKTRESRQTTSTIYSCIEVIFGWNYPNNVLNFWFSVYYFSLHPCCISFHLNEDDKKRHSVCIYFTLNFKQRERERAPKFFGSDWIVIKSQFLNPSNSNNNPKPRKKISSFKYIAIFFSSFSWILLIFFFVGSFSFHDSIAHFHLPMSRVRSYCRVIAKWFYGLVKNTLFVCCCFHFSVVLCSYSFVSSFCSCSIIWSVITFHLPSELSETFQAKAKANRRW